MIVMGSKQQQIQSAAANQSDYWHFRHSGFHMLTDVCHPVYRKCDGPPSWLRKRLVASILEYLFLLQHDASMKIFYKK
jgi:hypothetical protein